VNDLLRRTADLVDIPSPSLAEGPIADHVEEQLRRIPWLSVDRLGDDVVARTQLGRSQRVVLAGHLDTVPAAGNERSRIEGDTLWGLGAADMKGGLAVFLELAATVPEPALDVSYVFYTAEEVAAEHSGLSRLLEERPELLLGDAAVLGEPTDAWVEAGCQGTARVQMTLRGARAHTARPWMGRNAIHRVGRLLALVSDHEPRSPTIDGCTFRESAQAVYVEGGVAGNVVPDEATLTVNLRIAPDRSLEQGVAAFRDLVDDALEPGDRFEVVDRSDPAPPALDHPLLRRLVDQGIGVRAKLGWTDVARFAAAGMPAVNFGPGDATVAHTAAERVERRSIEQVHAALERLLTG
jgi:succinyl-diaminopimelate desuccinylase